MSLKLDGKTLSLEIEEKLKKDIESNKFLTKRPPGLAVIRIGDDPASGVYVKNKEKACLRVGIKSFIFHLKDSVEQEEVEKLINKLNLDNDLNNIFIVSQQKEIINYEKSQPSSIDNPVVDPNFNKMRAEDAASSTATFIVIGLLIAATIIPLATWWYFSK